MRMFVISDNTDTLAGMRLAGVEGSIAHEEPEIREAIEIARKNKDIGILLITEKLAAVCPDLVLELKSQGRRPLLVEIPDRYGTGRAADSITRYVREAIGIKI